MNKPRKRGTPAEGEPLESPPEFLRWKLRLYIAGQTPKSLTAFANLKQICEMYLAKEYEIELVDLLEKPWLAKEDEIIAVPTLVRKEPAPVRKAIGDLSDKERVIARLELPQAASFKQEKKQWHTETIQTIKRAGAPPAKTQAGTSWFST